MLCHSKGEKCVVEAKSGSRARVKWVGGLERSLTEKGSGDGVSWWQGGMSTALRTDRLSFSTSFLLRVRFLSSGISKAGTRIYLSECLKQVVSYRTHAE